MKAEIPCLQHFGYQHPADLLVRFQQQILIGKPQRLLHHIHHGRCELVHSCLPEDAQRSPAFFLAEAVEKQIVIIYHLTKADALKEEMVHEV